MKRENRMDDILGDLGASQKSGKQIPKELLEAAKAAGIPEELLDGLDESSLKRVEVGMGQRSLYEALMEAENEGNHSAIITPNGPMNKTQFLMKVLKKYTGMLWSGALGLAHAGIHSQKGGYPFYILSDSPDGESCKAGEKAITQAEDLLGSMIDDVLDNVSEETDTKDEVMRRMENTLLEHSIMMLKKTVAALEQIKRDNT